MENDIEKGDADIFRDTPIRYLGNVLLSSVLFQFFPAFQKERNLNNSFTLHNPNKEGPFERHCWKTDYS